MKRLILATSFLLLSFNAFSSYLPHCEGPIHSEIGPSIADKYKADLSSFIVTITNYEELNEDYDYATYRADVEFLDKWTMTLLEKAIVYLSETRPIDLGDDYDCFVDDWELDNNIDPSRYYWVIADMIRAEEMSGEGYKVTYDLPCNAIDTQIIKFVSEDETVLGIALNLDSSSKCDGVSQGLIFIPGDEDDPPTIKTLR
ncbi:MAG: hypothetical protein OXB88_03335 [Bacteriovoracales bacterium]|nr:hypothetical protein [Bacteriovoracales bacterium]